MNDEQKHMLSILAEFWAWIHANYVGESYESAAKNMDHYIKEFLRERENG